MNDSKLSPQHRPENSLVAGITKTIDFIYKILVQYSKFVLLVIVVIVSAQVFSRKLLHSSIRWSEEVTLLLMVWMAFISMAIGVEKNLHISIEVFFKHFPRPMQRIVNIINNLLVMLVGAVLLVYGVLLIKSTSSSTLPATQWPACMLYLMLPVGGFFIVYFSVLRVFGLERYHHWSNQEEDEENV